VFGALSLSFGVVSLGGTKQIRALRHLVESSETF
jgi:hypothetical protein